MITRHVTSGLLCPSVGIDMHASGGVQNRFLWYETAKGLLLFDLIKGSY